MMVNWDIRRMILAAMVALVCGVGSASEADNEPTRAYDLLFRIGTLDGMERGDRLVYRREITNALRPDTAERDAGQIILSLKTDGAKHVAFLELRRAEQHRGLGRFPASVGNPMIMYFYESVVRDMAESAGGSPYYIRNRVKEALIQPVPVKALLRDAAEGSQTRYVVRLHPFADDPNRARMQGFGDLELRIEMSEAAPGWYHSLTATAGEIYNSQIVFEAVERSQ